jgi:SAM-dependent methyltransferase
MTTHIASSFVELIHLLWINLVVKLRNLVEYIKVIFLYYGNARFRQVDLAFIRSYVFMNPYRISKKFLALRHEKDLYAYGETPITTFGVIAKQCGITKADTVFELGCGRGRGCFWFNTYLGCQVVGIEYIPEFVEKAYAIKKAYDLAGIEFRLQDILEADLSGATVIYLYGTCYESLFIKKLTKLMKALPPGTKVISVSYPLTDYAPDQFKVTKEFVAPFTWGHADVYLQELLSPEISSGTVNRSH